MFKSLHTKILAAQLFVVCLTTLSLGITSYLIIAAIMPSEQLLAIPHKLTILLLTIICLVVLVSILLSKAIARSIAKPIITLANTAKHLAKGEWGQEIDISSSDEIGILGHSFKEMSDYLYKMITTRDSEIELRKKVEQAIKHSHLELDQIFNTAAEGMVVINLSHEIMRVNDTFLKMMGLTRENVVGQNCHDIFPDRTCGRAQCVLNEMIRKNERIEIETEKRRSDGSPIICKLIVTPFLDIDGELIGIIEDFRDITITKKTEELMKMSEKRYRLLFNSAPDGIAVLNDQGVLIDCNQSLASIYKRSRAELIGRHFTHFNTPESAKNCHLNFKKIQELDQAEGEVHIKAPDGATITLWRKGTTIRDTKGYFNGVLIYDRDISKQKKIEELRDDMTRIARHDLKTPLNGIINLPLLIKQEKNLSEKQIKRLNLIEDAGYKMLAMINSSLDLYKMEEGSYRFVPVSVNLFPLLSKIREELWAEMQANQCRIDFFLNGSLADETDSFLVQGEELLCYSMLANLIRNAVESSPRGKTVSVYLDNTKQPKIEIHNHGQVPSSIQDRFFQKYVTAGKGKGTGLGTYSARLMARTMNGDIDMSSSEFNGTTIQITMPFHSGEERPEKARQIKKEALAKTIRPKKAISLEYNWTKMEGKRVLLAEDDPINQALAIALLQDKGFLVTPVVNGREVLTLFKEGHFDMILMDMQMPILNGIETTRLVRKGEETTGNRVPIIAVTGMTSEKDSEAFYEAGIDAIVPKPIQVALLWETINKLTGQDG